MKITLAGTGHVGLVTGVCLQYPGNHAICVDQANRPDQDTRAATDAERTRLKSGWTLLESFRACCAASVGRDLENRDWRIPAQEGQSGKSGPGAVISS